MSLHFPDMIKALRERESIILYNLSLNIPAGDLETVTEFLRDEYSRETLEYPCDPPAFDVFAAGWSAQTIYLAAQLILDRKQPPDDLQALFPPFEGLMDASAMLTCDLVFRFLPDLIRQLSHIDADDPLIGILVQTLVVWHYSGINYPLDGKLLNFEMIKLNPCLEQLYIDRVVRYKKSNLADHPALRPKLLADLGMYQQHFWNELPLTAQ